jgi:hypothetical protein
MDRFKSPTMAEERRAERQEELAAAVERKLAKMRVLKFDTRCRVKTILDDYFQNLQTLSDSPIDSNAQLDLKAELFELLEGPYFDCISKIEAQYERDLDDEGL